MRKNSIKNTRINGEVQKELSTLIRGEIKDPRIHPMTSVTAVEVAPDLKTCRAYISGSKESHYGRTEQRRRIYPQASGEESESEEYAGNPVHSGRIHRIWRKYVKADR